jgi:hypothetical protein
MRAATFPSSNWLSDMLLCSSASQPPGENSLRYFFAVQQRRAALAADPVPGIIDICTCAANKRFKWLPADPKHLAEPVSKRFLTVLALITVCVGCSVAVRTCTPGHCVKAFHYISLILESITIRLPSISTQPSRFKRQFVTPVRCNRA